MGFLSMTAKESPGGVSGGNLIRRGGATAGATGSPMGGPATRRS